jgi:predicted kinase
MAVGLPNSGKSFYWSKYFKSFIRLSTDDYIEWAANQLNLSYNEVFESQIGTASIVLNSIRDFAVSKNDSIFYDQTNLTKKTRKKKLNTFPKHYKKIAVFFDTPFEVCMKRNTTRPGKVIPQRVMLQMNESLTIPTVDEGFSEVLIVSHNESQDS